MPFLQKTLYKALILCFAMSLPAHAQWRDGGSRNMERTAPAVIPKDSMRKYWIEMLDNGNYIWTGVSLGIINPNFTRFADEVSFVPKKKRDLYGLRLRLSYSNKLAGLPTNYTREASALYGKVYKGYKIMATASAGLSYIWGRRWLEEIGTVTTPPARGLRTSSGTFPLYNSEKYWTIGIPVRAQAFFIAGKEVALGVTLGTTLNIKQLWGDAMLTVLLGIN